MEDQERKGPDPVPFIAHEAEIARFERANRRAAILCWILAAATILTNTAWIIHHFTR